MNERAEVARAAARAAEKLQIRHTVGAVLRYARRVQAPWRSLHPAAQSPIPETRAQPPACILPVVTRDA